MFGKSVSRLCWYLLLILGLSVFCFFTLNMWLLPYSIAYAKTGEITGGYLLYAVIGIMFSTPAPFIAVLIISIFKDKIGIKKMFRNIFRTEDKLKTVIITGFFCFIALVYAILYGSPTGTAWYFFVPAFLVMVPFVGIAEETGWRGLLQPELDKRMSFPFSVLIVGLIWYVWHFSLWLDPTSNHYGDSIIGFGITIFIWAFALAAIHKATSSVIACACYHSFIDSIGVIYNWNLLFDTFPGNLSTNIYRIMWLIFAIILWIVVDKKEKNKISNTY